jgi:hypothetical protein
MGLWQRSFVDFDGSVIAGSMKRVEMVVPLEVSRYSLGDLQAVVDARGLVSKAAQGMPADLSLGLGHKEVEIPHDSVSRIVLDVGKKGSSAL